jgi:hypothetical protein
MGLPWVRLDSNFHSHDKVLALLDEPSPKKWQAIALYTFGLGWSGCHGTDGVIPNYALKTIHGTPQVARFLVKYGLWDETTGGWSIRNYGDRQQLSDETYTVRKSQQLGGAKGNCVRWHGPDCGCWRSGGASVHPIG